MKLKLTFLAILFATTSNVFAQISHRCASYEYLKHLDAQNPGMEKYIKELPTQVKNDKKTRAQTITIPVVVHIVYKNATENLSDDYVTAQIDLLNKSYLRQNSDTTNLRTEFISIAGKANVQFMLSQIVRKSTTEPNFIFDYDAFNNNYADNVKYTSTGGSDAISPDKKLNIWVCDLGLPAGQGELLGFAYPPTGLANWGWGNQVGNAIDGVVIDYIAFGGTSKLPIGNATYGTVGKTTVHEVGHYLGLRHIWGDDNGKCAGQTGYDDDGISDTPDQADQSNFDCNKVKNTCNQGANDLKDMVENYMDYSKESCQNSFTKGQVSLMESVLANQRLNIRIPLGIIDEDISSNIILYPNPAQSNLNIGIINLNYSHAVVQLIDILGKNVKNISITNNNSQGIDISDIPKGLYIVNILIDNKYSNKQKVLIQ